MKRTAQVGYREKQPLVRRIRPGLTKREDPEGSIAEAGTMFLASAPATDSCRKRGTTLWRAS